MSVKLKPLFEQVIVVFGASSGIRGGVTAAEACRRGARVVAVGRDGAALAGFADELAIPDRLAVLVADAAEPDQVQAAADGAVARFGRLDTWAHVAGVAEHARFEDVPLQEFRRVIEVDLLGARLRRSRRAPTFARGRRRLRGGVVHDGQAVVPAAVVVLGGQAGVNGFLESLRVELAHDKVPVSVSEIQPATIGTPFFEHTRTRLGVRPSGPPPVDRPERVAEAILRAAEHPVRERVVGGAGRAQLLAQRISPRAVDMFARWAGYALQRSDERKGPDGPDGLDQPVPGDGRRRGVVSTFRR